MQESETPTLCKNLKKLQKNEACKQDAPAVAPESSIVHMQGPVTLGWFCHPAPFFSSLSESLQISEV